jgi:hypothetical protein
MKRQFDQQEYNRSNQKAIIPVAGWLTGKGYVVDTTEDFGADIRAHAHNKVEYHEVEINNQWKGKFKYPHIQICERKDKLWEKHPIEDLTFWQLSWTGKSAWKFPACAVATSNKVQLWCNCREGRVQEWFYRIPIDNPSVERITFNK